MALPDNLQSMSVENLQALLDRMNARKAEIQSRLAEIDQQLAAQGYQPDDED